MLLPASAARAAPLRDGRFRQGVLSGDPTPDGATLLTILDDVEGRGTVRLEVARDAGVPARRGLAHRSPPPAAPGTRSRRASAA